MRPLILMVQVHRLGTRVVREGNIQRFDGMKSQFCQAGWSLWPDVCQTDSLNQSYLNPSFAFEKTR